MNKGELIEAVAQATGLAKKAAGEAVQSAVDAITKSLKKGESVALVGFGTFKVTKRNARKGVNPATGKAIQIKAKNVVKFKAGSELAATVNKK